MPFRAMTVAIQRHVKIRGLANPFDPEMGNLLCPPSNRKTFRRAARYHPMALNEWLEPDAG